MAWARCRALTALCAALLPTARAVSAASSAAAVPDMAAQPAESARIDAVSGLFPNLADNVDRPRRYAAQRRAFVIVDGAERFNRPLYGGNTAFRVDGGDRPEFVLYLPGRGGNLRLGLRRGSAVKWLHEAARIVTRYVPGTLSYEIRDPLLGADGALRIDVLALHSAEGLLLRARRVGHGAAVELFWAYGGVNGERGRRDGDIGTESVPIGEFFQLQPEFCRDNVFTLTRDGFVLHSPAATIVGTAAPRGVLGVSDATRWASPGELLAAAARGLPAPERPVVVGRTRLGGGAFFLALERVPDGSKRRTPAARLPQLFADATAHFASLRRQIEVETEDADLDAAVAALNVAADAVWDEPSGTVQHGAVAWRRRLLGWRGPYAMDALGWHERARRHLLYWAARQNADPVPDVLPGADEATNLARSEAALHSNGDLSDSHYDMNLVYLDALFRHLLWTGDLELARRLWPVLERHLAWERRLFRREFGAERLPLYEGYAAIWASDDLQYHGGGVTHASAYNYWHNRMAARLARQLGREPSLYEREADAIARAARTHLWLEDQGTFAEFKDLLGRQLVHPSAGLWTFYHAMDSGLPTELEAWRMAADVDSRIPHLPVRGPGVPPGLHVLSTTDWMPYTWSVNNVVFAENVHAALGYWQARRPSEAYRLLEGALLASMYMGICPGNVGSMNYLDVYRRESQRDFADPVGVLSRAVVEGLFGVRPDALSGELRVEPGFPDTWTRARLRHPDLGVEYERRGARETFRIDSRFPRPQALRLVVRARRQRVAAVLLDGGPVAWSRVAGAAGERLEILAPPRARHVVVVAWAGARASAPGVPSRASAPEPQAAPMDWTSPRPAERWETVDLAAVLNDGVTRIFEHEYRSPRSPFVSLAIPKQGLGGWAGSFAAKAEIDDTGLRTAAASGGGRLRLPSGLPFATAGPGSANNVAFVSQWDNFPREIHVPLSGRAGHLYLLMAGTTNAMQSRLDDGEVVVRYRGGSQARLPLHNPTTWWPIEQDYFVDDFAFRRPGPIPPRLDLRTGLVRLLEPEAFKGRGGPVPGGAATVLHLPLDADAPLDSLTVRALANEVVIGLIAATLER